MGPPAGMNKVSHDESTPSAPGGSTVRFEDVFMPHMPAAYNLARWLLQNDSDAEDAVQEAYLRAFKAFSQFRGGDGRAWLLTIVRNACYNLLRKNKKHDADAPFDEEMHGVVDDSAEVALRQQASAEVLRRALENIPTEYREIIVMRDIEDLSYKEIAEIAGIPIGTVMSRLARARKRLEGELRTTISSAP